MFAIAIHGGAGTISRNDIHPEIQKKYECALQEALDTGYDVLASGESALDAVTAAVKALENCPLFNAGKGSVFNHQGKHEMDASVMRGDNKMAGAVLGVKHIKNPVILARTIMEQSEHVMMCAEGAEEFARLHRIEFAPDEYFYDEFRYRQLQEALAAGKIQLDHSPSGDKKFSTVGAVALDKNGNIAAATSTGGMTNKQFGRIGDTPVIGAGTYANNATCAISCTGHGEYFIRQVAAYQVHSLMAYKNLSLEEACNIVVMDELKEAGGEGGLIAIDSKGNISMPFNSEGMYRGQRNSEGLNEVRIYRD